MNDRQIGSFISVVQNRSFSAAAEKQFISPQALIQQINLLENEIGVKLLLRTNKGVSTTPAGERFCREMLRISREITALTSELRKGTERKQYSLNIGLFEHSQMMQRICTRFSEERPDVSQRYALINPEDWISALDDFSSKQIDVFEHAEIPNPQEYGLLFTPLERVHCVCVMERSHPLAQKRQIQIADLDGQNLGIHHETCVQGLLQALAEEAPHAVLKNDGRGKIAAFDTCAEGGVFIFPANFGELCAPLTIIPLQSECTWTFGLLYPQNCDSVVEDFVRCAKNVCRLKTEQ